MMSGETQLCRQTSVRVLLLQVDWGEASMITAERILLSHALKDPLNDRFVFVSDRYTLQTHF
jgi:hypothetical protein